MKDVTLLDWERVNHLIDLAIAEDVGSGDATSIAVIDAKTVATAELICKEPCVCAGLEVAAAVFNKVDPALVWSERVSDGDHLAAGIRMALVKGCARSILTGERTALNFLQRLCGVATVARRYADAVAGTRTVVLDTRKTTPGWRNLEKYAVAIGGTSNHRIGLYDRILVKDNHRALAGLEGPGGIRRSVERSRQKFPKLEVEVEVESIDELREAIEAKADYVLLDNMTDEMMAEAVKITDGRLKLEASGGITLERLPRVAATGVDFVSVGALTHSVKSTDISLEIVLA